VIVIVVVIVDVVVVVFMVSVAMVVVVAVAMAVVMVMVMVVVVEVAAATAVAVVAVQQQQHQVQVSQRRRSHRCLDRSPRGIVADNNSSGSAANSIVASPSRVASRATQPVSTSPPASEHRCRSTCSPREDQTGPRAVVWSAPALLSCACLCWVHCSHDARTQRDPTARHWSCQ
jgi:hypothetical protein